MPRFGLLELDAVYYRQIIQLHGSTRQLALSLPCLRFWIRDRWQFTYLCFVVVSHSIVNRNRYFEGDNFELRLHSCTNNYSASALKLGRGERSRYFFCRNLSHLDENPEALSWSGRLKPSPRNSEGLNKLAIRYLDGFRKSDFPTMPGTVPDEMVSVVLETAYNYTAEEASKVVLITRKQCPRRTASVL